MRIGVSALAIAMTITTLLSVACGGINGRIAFVSDRGDRNYGELYVMDADGSDVSRLTNYHANYPNDGDDGNGGIHLLMNPDGSTRLANDNSERSIGSLSWSQDGQTIAASFFDRDGDQEIYGILIVNSDNFDVTRFINTTGMPMDDLSLSPDSRYIAFSSYDESHNGAVFAIDLVDFKMTRLTGGNLGRVSLAWSPDGQRIAFNSYVDGNSDIYEMIANGTGMTKLTSDGSDVLVAKPAWSPDGQRISFSNSEDIYVMDADGSAVIRLTVDSPARSLIWSPDGRRIAFFAHHHRYVDANDIYVMNADGSAVFRLPIDNPSPGRVRDLAWSPDGRRIAFSASVYTGNRREKSEIYVVNEDGSNLTRLTNNDAYDGPIAWGGR